MVELVPILRDLWGGLHAGGAVPFSLPKIQGGL